MADTFYFSSLPEAGDALQDALSDIIDMSGDGKHTVIDAKHYEQLRDHCRTIVQVREDIHRYLDHLERGTSPDDHPVPTREDRMQFHQAFAGELGAFQAMGFKGSEDAVDAMLSQALHHEDDELLSSDDNLSHGAVLVEYGPPEKFLRQMDAQLSYILRGTAWHFVAEDARATGNDGQLDQAANAANLTDISYEGPALERDNTPQL